MPVEFVRAVDHVGWGAYTQTLTIDATGGNYILAFVSIRRGNDQIISGVTFNGDNLSPIGSQLNPGSIAGHVFGMATPDQGSYELTVTLTGDTASVYLAGVVFSGVSAVGTREDWSDVTTTAVEATDTVTSETNGLVVTCCCVQGDVSGSLASAAGQTTREGPAAAGADHTGIVSTKAGSASVTMGHTWTGGARALQIMVPITPAGAPSTFVPQIIMIG